MTVLVVEHERDAPAGLLTLTNMRLQVVRPYLGEDLPAPPDLQRYDGLVVLGGEMDAHSDAEYAWIGPTKTLIAAAVRTELPTLLICLGHQLAAVALGGTVRRSTHGPTWGVFPVGPTPEAADDPLLRHLRDGARVVHWNGDVVTEAPAGATVLARDPHGQIQAVRYGPTAWGVQCHPEVDVEIVRGWAHSQDDARRPGSIDRAAAALAEVAEDAASIREAWMPVLEAYAAMTGPR